VKIAEIISIPCAICKAPKGMTCKRYRERTDGPSIHQQRKDAAKRLERHAVKAVSK
jgi:hypothetical protein